MAVPDSRRQFVTLARGADCADCSTKTLRRAIARGELRAYRLGNSRAIRLDLAELDAWMRPIPTAKAG
jgi:excisionase family DNA binding protein